MTTIEILEHGTGKSHEAGVDLKEKTHEKNKPQPRFFCSNCDHEIFLRMLYCDECGGEIAWPEKYKAVLPKKEKEQKKK
jgi:uncharacterized protein YlaI